MPCTEHESTQACCMGCHWATCMLLSLNVWYAVRRNRVWPDPTLCLFLPKSIEPIKKHIISCPFTIFLFCPAVPRQAPRCPYGPFATGRLSAVGLCVLGWTHLVHSSSDCTSICWKVLISSRFPKIRATSKLLILQKTGKREVSEKEKPTKQAFQR